MIFDNLKELSGSLDKALVTPELCKPNDFYGHASILKKYAGFKSCLKAVVEHGIVFNQEFWKVETNAEVPCIIACSNLRLQTVTRFTNKAGFAIGPYVHYADGLFTDEQLGALKKSLGSILLVFPAHSTHHNDIHYDVDLFTTRIKAVSTDYQSVVVCLYWKDVLRGFADKYLQHGFLCTTCGHMYDFDFLNRMKTILCLSDSVITNSISTHVIYSAYFKKPVYFFQQDMSATIRLDVPEYDIPRLNPVEHTIGNLLSEYRHDISPRQWEVLYPYTGIEQIRTREELKDIFMICEDMYGRGKQFFMASENVLFDQIGYYLGRRELHQASILIRQAEQTYPKSNRVKKFAAQYNFMLTSVQKKNQMPCSQNDLLDAARQALIQKNFQKALQLASSLKSSNILTVGVDLLRAQAFAGKGENHAAYEAVKEELRSFPANIEARKLYDQLESRLWPNTPVKTEAERLIVLIKPYTMVGEERLKTLYELARTVCLEDIPGHFVECGIAAGGSAALIAAVIRKYSKRPRLLFCFDTFEGMPESGEEDLHQNIPANATGGGAGSCAVSEQSLLDICSKLDVRNMVVPIKGLFKDTLPRYRSRIGKIAFLHMDGDWYASTRDILENLFDQIVSQGCVQVDDYGHREGCKKALHEYEDQRCLHFVLNTIDGTGVWFQKPASSSPIIPKPDRKFLNLGCGHRYHPAWVNVNFTATGPGVIAHNLNQGLPFEDNSAEVVYHSHLLEHFPRAFAPRFIQDCNRVLKPGGILRVVVPDLEAMARHYLRMLEQALAGDVTAQKRYEWILLEMFDQMVRNVSGGEMLAYWHQNPMPAEDFVFERLGSEVKDAVARIRSQGGTHGDPHKAGETPPPDALRIGQFRLSGEIHQWMYDRYSLGKLLEEAGFGDIRVCRANESRIPDFNSYLLDIEADGAVRKPDSLFMEAVRPNSSQTCAEPVAWASNQGLNSPELIKKPGSKTLDPNDVQWIGVRFLDNVSCTFIHANKFYKAIYPSALGHFKALYKRGIYDDLISHRLIPEMQFSNYQMDGFPVILEQQTECFNFDSQCWNPLMLKDAALKYIEINKYLLSKNLILKDGHTANIIFQENSIPKWCDIGSIVTGNNRSADGLREFIQFFVYPLMIRQKSAYLSSVSRYFTSNACTEGEASMILDKNISLHAGRREILDGLEQLVTGIDFSWPETTWSSYHGDLTRQKIDVYDIEEEEHVSRNNMVKKLLLSLKPATVVDIGSNAGVFSVLAAQIGAEVLALEPDETAAAKCYQNFNRFDQLKAKVAMSQAGFTGGHIPDLTIALALTHHMFFTGMYRMEIIARILADCTRKALITEFMPNGLGGYRPIPCPLPANYRLDIFLKELSRFFKKIEHFEPFRPSETSSRRIFIFAHDKTGR